MIHFPYDNFRDELKRPRLIIGIGDASRTQFHACGHWCQDMKLSREDKCCVCFKSPMRCAICAHS